MLFDGGVLGEEFVDHAFEDAHAVTVDDADAGDFAEDGGIEEAFEVVLGVEGGFADEVEFAGEGIPTRTGAGEGDAGGEARGGGGGSGGEDFEDFGEGNLHFEEADFDFEAAGAGEAEDFGGLTDVAEADADAGLDFVG